METFDQIKDKVNCCGCGKPMTESQHTNLVTTRKRATWQFPVAGNVITGVYGQAIAIVCDDCIKTNAKINNVVQFDHLKIIYHDIDSLEDFPRLASKNTRVR